MKRIILLLGLTVVTANLAAAQTNRKDTLMHHKSYDSDTSKRMKKSKQMNKTKSNHNSDTALNGMGR